MKRLLTALTSLLCVIGLLGCNDGNRLALDKVVELSAKGEDLTWSDFERYESKDVGSGLYIYLYDIDDTFGLWIGGVPSDKPIYMRLATKADMDNCIDIRTDDVTVILAGMTLWTVLMYRAFSYDGKRQMSRQIIDGVAEYVKLPWPNGRTFFGRMGD